MLAHSGNMSDSPGFEALGLRIVKYIGIVIVESKRYIYMQTRFTSTLPDCY
jgi:hypothetical protein